MRPRTAETYTQAAGFYFAHGNAEAAEELWRRAATLDLKNVACRSALAELYERSGRERQALQAWGQLCGLQPRNATCYLKVGELHVRARHFDAAEKAFAMARQIAPQLSFPHRALAQVYLQTNRNHAEALSLARTAVQLEPIAPNYFVLGVACENNGDHAGALSAVKRAMTIDPENAKYKQTYDQLQRRN